MSTKDPYRHYYQQHNDAVDRALKARRQKPAPIPQPTGDPENPWSQAGWSITAQMRLTETNPAEAKRLCELANKKWVPPHGYYNK